MTADPDVPHEPVRWEGPLMWLLALWPRAKDRLHRWLHRDRPACPDCAEWRAKADAQADECRAEEAAHDATASQLRAALAIAQNEKARADEAERQLALTHEEWITDPSPAERVAQLTYAQVVASQPPKPPGVIPEAMSDAACLLAAPPAESWGRVDRPVLELVLAKGEVAMGCTVREAGAATQLIKAIKTEVG